MLSNLTTKSPAGTLIYTTDTSGNLIGTGTYLGGVKQGRHASGRWTLDFWCQINGVARWMSFPKTYTDAAELPPTALDTAQLRLRWAKRDLEEILEDAANGADYATPARVQEFRDELAAAEAQVERYTTS